MRRQSGQLQNCFRNLQLKNVFDWVLRIAKHKRLHIIDMLWCSGILFFFPYHRITLRTHWVQPWLWHMSWDTILVWTMTPQSAAVAAGWPLIAEAASWPPPQGEISCIHELKVLYGSKWRHMWHKCLCCWTGWGSCNCNEIQIKSPLHCHYSFSLIWLLFFLHFVLYSN